MVQDDIGPEPERYYDWMIWKLRQSKKWQEMRKYSKEKKIEEKHKHSNAVMLDLKGKKEKANDELPVFDKFKGKISDTVKKILKEKLELTDDKIEVDPTENKYDFTGRGRGVLNIVRDLCRRSVPVGGDAGYFFYQTKSAFKYK